MRYLALVALTAMLVAFPQRSAAEEAQKPSVRTENMTVAELEKAGDNARTAKDYESAILYFEAAVRKDKKNAKLFNKLGLSYLKANRLSDARFSFERAVKNNSKYADALNNLGAVYFVQRNLNGATKYFKKAVAMDETRPVFHVNLGAAWFGQNKVDRAIAEYGRALQLDPTVLSRSNNGGVTAQVTTAEERARYDYMLAKVYAKLGNPEECLRCLRKAKEEGYRNIANVYKDEEFSQLRQDARLAEIAPPPPAKQ